MSQRASLFEEFAQKAQFCRKSHTEQIIYDTQCYVKYEEAQDDDQEWEGKREDKKRKGT